MHVYIATNEVEIIEEAPSYTVTKLYQYKFWLYKIYAVKISPQQTEDESLRQTA